MSDDPLADLDRALKPYRGTLVTHARLPEAGVPREQVLADLELMADAERARWESGQVSGAVYEGEPDHVAFLNQAYALHSQSNPLHLDVWPSAAKLEAEIVSMTAGMLGADAAGDEISGTVTSGGTESIMLAMRAYRERGRAAGIDRPVMVLPETAHAAFDKAADAFGIEQRKVPVTEGFVADVEAMAAAIDERTVVVVGSAPAFPHGLVDPIERLSEIARERGVGFHTDGCLGGFLLPWAARLGYDVPPFDFRLPGVTSMSADTHKFGYAAKGTSVVLYRGAELRHHQYFTFTDWPGGLYATPTFAGSRPGGLSAACWAAMVAFGESGYLDATRRILEAAAEMKDAIRGIDGLELLGEPLYVLAFRTTEDGLDVYRVMDEMTARGWSLNGLHRPACVHLCVTLRHTQPELPARFAADLREAVDAVRAAPQAEGGMAPIYGLAASVPDRTLISGFLEQYMDRWYVP
ncbi:MAG TPA: aminotransferase class V-fold PLP-dependent enzyme [Solirubrobacteraceae bacterium]|nr:aminotransferase class V-fold PLP-dependent enzyme [Solirubrobacteraceae bacterium]